MDGPIQTTRIAEWSRGSPSNRQATPGSYGVGSIQGLALFIFRFSLCFHFLILLSYPTGVAS